MRVSVLMHEITYKHNREVKMKKFSVLLIIALLLVSVFVFTGCGKSTTPDNGQNSAEPNITDPGELVVYSGRNEKFVEAMLDKFSADTGIKVVALHGANPLQVVEEANNVQADVFISNDLGALGYLHMQELLQGSNPKGIETIPAGFRSDDNAY